MKLDEYRLSQSASIEGIMCIAGGRGGDQTLRPAETGKGSSVAEPTASAGMFFRDRNGEIQIQRCTLHL